MMSELDSHDLERILRWGVWAAATADFDWSAGDHALLERVRRMFEDTKTRERAEEARQEAHMGADDE